ncbi:MAG TPA: hypothetical protein V6D20_05985, partial [Candidatus Obscuribacterales bacterium]
ELDKYVDQTARDRGYKSMDSVGKFLTVGNPFEAEAKALSLWTGEIYATAFAMLQQFKAGEIEPPTLAEVIAALPTPPAT